MLTVSDGYAVMFLIGSCFLYSLQNANVKYAGVCEGFWTLTFIRGAVGVLLSAICILIFYKRNVSLCPVKHNKFKILLLRAFLGGITNITAFYAILKTNLLYATLVSSTSPLITAAITHMCIPGKVTQPWTRIDTLASLCCIGSIYVIVSHAHSVAITNVATTDSDYVTNIATGILSASISAITQAGVNITIKEMKEEKPLLIAFYGTLGGMVLSLSLIHI